MKNLKALPNVHPGEVLLEEFLLPFGISQNALARAMDVPPRRINEIVLGKRRISADTAVRLALAFGTSERFWQGRLITTEEAHRHGRHVDGIERLAAWCSCTDVGRDRPCACGRGCRPQYWSCA
jgi:addiction module HigA family antidote